MRSSLFSAFSETFPCPPVSGLYWQVGVLQWPLPLTFQSQNGGHQDQDPEAAHHARRSAPWAGSTLSGHGASSGLPPSRWPSSCSQAGLPLCRTGDHSQAGFLWRHRTRRGKWQVTALPHRWPGLQTLASRLLLELSNGPGTNCRVTASRDLSPDWGRSTILEAMAALLPPYVRGSRPFL